MCSSSDRDFAASNLMKKGKTMSAKKNRLKTDSNILNQLGLGADDVFSLEGEEDLWSSKHSDDELIAALKSNFTRMRSPETFKPGDVVIWKTGMKNRLQPKTGKPAVVMQMLDSPVRDTERDAGSAYFNEPLDMVLGIILEEGKHKGDFLEWHFDSRRFQHWKKS